MREPRTTRHHPLAGPAVCALFLLVAQRGAAQVAGTILPAQVYPTTQADDIAIGDVDGDGSLDIAVLGHGPSVTILRNSHKGEMIPGPVPYDVALGTDAYYFALGDLDGDGDLEIVVSFGSGKGVGVCVGHGDGTFDYPVIASVPGWTNGIAVADLTGDGVADYAVCNSSTNEVDIGRGLGDGTFDEPVGYATGGTFPYEIAVGDVDGASGPDLVITNTGSDNVTVLLNDGLGAFTLADVVPAGDVPSALALADLDGDGALDLAVVNAFQAPISMRVELVEGLGNGTFAAPTYLPTALAKDVGRGVAAADLDGDGDTDLAFLGGPGTPDRLLFMLQGPTGFVDPPRSVRVGDGPRALAIGDFSGDGLPDVAVAGDLDQIVAVVIGDGGGAFVAPPPTYPLTGNVSALSLSDMNADGRVDLVSVRTGPIGHTVSVMLGDGLGNLSAPIDTEVLGNADNSPNDLVVDDFDDDGVPDVCILDSTGDRIQVLAGLGDGTFGPKQDYACTFDPTRIRSGDLDGDGLPDLVLLRRDWDAAVVMPGLGGGAFGTPQVFAVGDMPYDLALSDLDGSGTLDLIVANKTSKDISVFSGAGNGTFVPKQTLALSGSPLVLAVLDIDGDGTLDLLASVGADTEVRRGLGDGTFEASAIVSPGTFQAVADLDLDGAADLIGQSFLPGVTVMRGHGDGGFDLPREYIVDNTFLPGVADFDSDGVPDLLLAASTKQILLGRLDPRWIDLGKGLAGTLGVPLLHGTGPLTVGSALTLRLSYARPNSVAALFIGLSQVALPFKGGTLVPAADILFTGLPVDGSGASELRAIWPAAVPPGVEFFLQEWVADPAGPAGYAASNGVRATAQ